MRNRLGIRGFTLIELLIVVAIIAILALIAVPNFLEAQTRAKVSREKNDLRSLAVAIEAYHVDHSVYPPWTDRTGRYNWPCSVRFAWLTTPIAYITSVPVDPYGYKKHVPIPPPSGVDAILDTYAYASCDGSFDDDWYVFSHMWRCAGVGPASINWWGPGGAPIPYSFGFPDYIYDPTNGTVSFGYIVRVGPRSPTTHRGYHPIETLPW